MAATKRAFPSRSCTPFTITTTPAYWKIVHRVSGISTVHRQGACDPLSLRRNSYSRGRRFEGPYDNPLYNLWVTRTSLPGFAGRCKKTNQHCTILPLLQFDETHLPRGSSPTVRDSHLVAAETTLRSRKRAPTWSCARPTSMCGLDELSLSPGANSFISTMATDLPAVNFLSSSCDKEEYWSHSGKRPWGLGAFHSRSVRGM